MVDDIGGSDGLDRRLGVGSVAWDCVFGRGLGSCSAIGFIAPGARIIGVAGTGVWASRPGPSSLPCNDAVTFPF